MGASSRFLANKLYTFVCDRLKLHPGFMGRSSWLGEPCEENLLLSLPRRRCIHHAPLTEKTSSNSFLASLLFIVQAFFETVDLGKC